MTLAATRGFELLRCPTCHGSLAGEARLSCHGCGRSYEVVEGIPRLLDETVPGVAAKAREAEGWAAMAQAQGWYEPDDEVDAALPYLCRDLGWDERTWRANEHSFGLLLDRLRPGQRVLEVGAAKCWGARHVIARRMHVRRHGHPRRSQDRPRPGRLLRGDNRALSSASRRTARAFRSPTGHSTSRIASRRSTTRSTCTAWSPSWRG